MTKKEKKPSIFPKNKEFHKSQCVQYKNWLTTGLVIKQALFMFLNLVLIIKIAFQPNSHYPRNKHHNIYKKKSTMTLIKKKKVSTHLTRVIIYNHRIICICNA